MVSRHAMNGAHSGGFPPSRDSRADKEMRCLPPPPSPSPFLPSGYDFRMGPGTDNPAAFLGCGQDAADAYCRLRGYEKASVGREGGRERGREGGMEGGRESGRVKGGKVEIPLSTATLI
jgi:hypothetical protein